MFSTFLYVFLMLAMGFAIAFTINNMKKKARRGRVVKEGRCLNITELYEIARQVNDWYRDYTQWSQTPGANLDWVSICVAYDCVQCHCSGSFPKKKFFFTYRLSQKSLLSEAREIIYRTIDQGFGLHGLSKYDDNLLELYR